MFKKLLKYDFKDLKRTGLPMLVTILILTVVISIFVGIMVGKGGYSENVNVFEIMATVFVAFAGLLILVSPVVIQIMVYENFYRTLTTDEGYLTFTLPVKVKQIIFSKITNGAIWTVTTGAAVLVSFVTIVIVGVLSAGATLGGGSSDTTDIVSSYTVWSIILSVILSIVSYFAMQLLYFIIIFWGSTMFKSQKSSNVIWLLILGNLAISAVVGTITSVIEVVGAAIGVATNNMEVSMIITLATLLIFTGGLMVGAFFLLKHMMEKKVNLP